MTLALSSDRAFVRATGGSRRHLVIRWTAPPRTVVEQRPAVRVGFSLDRSGSMAGQKLVLAREALLGAVALLEERDAFSIVAFDDRVELVAPLRNATAEAKAEARRAVAGIEARANTNLFRGFLTACETIAPGPGVPDGMARCMLLTDGQANAEETNPERLAAHAGALRERGIGLSTFGVGADFDEVLLRAMADAGGGNFFYVGSADQIPVVMRRELSEVLLISQRGVRARLSLPHGVSARLIGEHRVDAGDVMTVHLGDLVADEQIELVVSLQFPRDTAGVTAPLQVRIEDERGACGESTFTWTYAEGMVNDTQSRNVVADRLIGQRHADKTRLRALRLNRKGEFAEIGRMFHDLVAHIRSYAGTDPELLALIAQLTIDEREYARRMDEIGHKSRHMTSSSRIRGKETTGSASRPVRLDEE